MVTDVLDFSAAILDPDPAPITFPRTDGRFDQAPSGPPPALALPSYQSVQEAQAAIKSASGRIPAYEARLQAAGRQVAAARSRSDLADEAMRIAQSSCKDAALIGVKSVSLQAEQALKAAQAAQAQAATALGSLEGLQREASATLAQAQNSVWGARRWLAAIAERDAEAIAAARTATAKEARAAAIAATDAADQFGFCVWLRTQRTDPLRKVYQFAPPLWLESLAVARPVWMLTEDSVRQEAERWCKLTDGTETQRLAKNAPHVILLSALSAFIARARR